jgi:hypothetical protein
MRVHVPAAITTATVSVDVANAPTTQRRGPREDARQDAGAEASSVGELRRLAPRALLRLSRQSPDRCAICDRGKSCPGCAQRRRCALRLRDQEGLSVPAIAAYMSLSTARVARLLEQAADRQAISRLTEDTYVSNLQLRALFHLRKREDPGFSASELARRAGFSSGTAVERDLGLMRTSDTVSKGRHYPGRLKTTVLVANAERLLRGMDCDPRDIETLLAGDDLVPTSLQALAAHRRPVLRPVIQAPHDDHQQQGKDMTSNRRQLPENLSFGEPGINISVFLQSTAQQWEGVVQVAQGVKRVTSLSLCDGIVHLVGELASGRLRARRVLQDGTIKQANSRLPAASQSR